MMVRSPTTSPVRTVTGSSAPSALLRRNTTLSPPCCKTASVVTASWVAALLSILAVVFASKYTSTKSPACRRSSLFGTSIRTDALRVASDVRCALRSTLPAMCSPPATTVTWLPAWIREATLEGTLASTQTTDSSTNRNKVCPGSTRWPTTKSSSRSEEHTSELQSLMRISYAVFYLKKKKKEESTNETAK